MAPIPLDDPIDDDKESVFYLNDDIINELYSLYKEYI